MDYTDISAFAMCTPNVGYNNQILGAFRALADLSGTSFDNNAFILPEGIADIADVKDVICFSQFANYTAFRNQIFAMLDLFFQRHSKIPQIFVTAYSLTESDDAGTNTDMLCRAIKEYYRIHNLGFVLTTVLNSRIHKYKYVDLFNAPKHLLTFRSRMRLLQNKKLRQKALITIGTINNFTLKTVKEKFSELKKKFQDLKNDSKLAPQIQKLEAYSKTAKKVVFCLGGRVEGNEILFNLSYAKELFIKAEKIARIGYGVVFVNGPRTPNDVTDFLFEKAANHPTIIFQNSKKIAQDDADRQPSRWRIYSGPHEEEFKISQKLGNIYPGILGYTNTLIVHSADSYSCCETANVAIPTAIAKTGLYIDTKIRYDCVQLFDLLCPKYVIDFDDFVYFALHMKIEPKDLHPQILSSPLRVFAETALNRLLSADNTK